MTDDELLAKLKKAESLMAEYVAVAQEAATELAVRQSQLVYGVDDAYSGNLGCYEEGKDTICLHITEAFEQRARDEMLARMRSDDKYEECSRHKFQRQWREAAGLRLVYLSGHH